MLNSALNHMLDKTECLWFINTENSVIPLDKIGKPDQTISPWIYSEIVMANTLRKKIPERYGYEKRSLEHASKLNESVLITHQIEMENFKLCGVALNYSGLMTFKNKLIVAPQR